MAKIPIREPKDISDKRQGSLFYDNLDKKIYMYNNGALISIADLLKDWVCVKDYGAKGNGISDDSTAFQKAINTGKNVYIPDGNYLIGSTIVLTSNIIISGGNNTVLIPKIENGSYTLPAIFSSHEGLTSNNFTGNCIVTDGSETRENVIIQNINFQFDHASLNDPINPNCSALHLEYGKNIIIQNCKFTTTQGGWKKALHIFLSEYITIRNNYTKVMALVWLGACGNCLIDNNYIEESYPTAIESLGGFNNTYSNNIVKAVTANVSAVGINERHAKIINNSIRASDGNGTEEGNAHSLVLGHDIDSTTILSTYPYIIYNGETYADASYSVIIANYFYGTDPSIHLRGILIQGGEHIRISHNYFYNLGFNQSSTGYNQAAIAGNASTLTIGNLIITDNVFEKVNRAFRCGTLHGTIIFKNNIVKDITGSIDLTEPRYYGEAINLSSTGTGTIKTFIIENNEFYNVKCLAYLLEPQIVIVRNNTIVNQPFDNDGTSNRLIRIAGDVKQVIFSNNNIYNPNGPLEMTYYNGQANIENNIFELNDETRTLEQFIDYRGKPDGFTMRNNIYIVSAGTLNNNNIYIALQGTSISGHFDKDFTTPFNIKNLPTSSSGLSSGDIWNDGGTLKIV